MNIECSREQFKTLMDLVYAGNLLINGNRSQENRISQYEEMEQMIYKLAVANGFTDYIEYSEEYKEYMPTHQYEEDEFNDYIDAYDTAVFWEELVMRLARRDALNYAGDVNPDVTKAELKKMQMELEEKYEDEIERNGIMNLKIVTLKEDE